LCTVTGWRNSRRVGHVRAAVRLERLPDPAQRVHRPGRAGAEPPRDLGRQAADVHGRHQAGEVLGEATLLQDEPVQLAAVGVQDGDRRDRRAAVSANAPEAIIAGRCRVVSVERNSWRARFATRIALPSVCRESPFCRTREVFHDPASAHTA
jgi:hypothetical protein